MKKIFTLLFTVGTLTAGIAQTHQPVSRFQTHEVKKVEDSYSFTTRQRDEQIARINTDFNAKIKAVKFDRYLKQNQKTKQIAKLEVQKTKEINAVKAKFANKRNRLSGSYAYGRH